MSRAVSQEVKRALGHGDHEKIFAEIAAVLSEAHEDLLEIELLGAGHPLLTDQSYLRDGNAIAIPKARLVQAFVVGRKIMSEPASEVHSTAQERELQATAVLLLMDPEHLTAANRRKRVINQVLAASNDDNKILLREKFFLDSLLTSRLYRHSKSPTLWSHRQWLIRRSHDAGFSIDSEQDLSRVIFMAGERHPRNYYAWLHARFMMHDKIDKKTAQQASSPAVLEVKKWCHAHHDDVSGWAFLMFLLGAHPTDTEMIVGETLSLAKSFHWRNESVWYFLRNMMSTGKLSGALRMEFHRVQAFLLGSAEPGSQAERVLKQSAVWAERYKATVEP